MSRVSIGSIGLLLVSSSCSPSYEEMRTALDQLEIPSSYVLIAEDNEGSFPGFFGETPRVFRRYRSPHDFEATCGDVMLVAEPFRGLQSGEKVREGGHRWICSVWFEVDGFAAGLTALGPLSPEAAREFGAPENEPVYIDVKIRDERF